MRYAIAALFFVAGCGDSIHPDEMPEDQIGDEGTEVEVDPEVYEHPKTAELDTEKLRPIAKCIHWPEISSREGDTYHGDALVVDRILREDSANNYGVRIRLKNTTKDFLKMEYLIRFVTKSGGQLGGYQGSSGAGDRWTPFVIEPINVKEIGDFCRITGAEGFRLFIRGGGSTTDGAPDDPEKRAERRAQRSGRN